jgi:uncharacterized protein (TIGR04551 family)
MADPQPVADRLDLFPSTNLFSMDLHGSFRLRTELWHQLDMGLYPSPNRYGLQPSMEQDYAALRETTDIRFRLQPSLLITERATVHLDVDLFYMGAGRSGVSDYGDLLRQDFGVTAPGAFDDPTGSAFVRSMWVDFKVFHALQISLGRVPMHWGMGILENDGRDWDADGGDAVDGATFKFTMDNWEARITLDWPLEGKTAVNAWSPWGASYDLGDKDDLWQWRLHFASHEKGPKFRLDWGVYARFRLQEYSSTQEQGSGAGCSSDNPAIDRFNCDELYWRDALIVTPDFWIRLQAELNPVWDLVLEGELVGRYGTLSATQRFSGEDTSKTMYGIGGVVQGRLQSQRWKLGVEFGAASGDRGSKAFGIVDGYTIAEPDTSMWEGSTVAANHTVTSLALHPLYRPDLILFRRVIGAVTNAWYLKPSVEWSAVRWGSDSRFFLDLSVLYAAAFVEESTPGNDGPLGLETTLTAGLDVGRHVQARLQGAVLVPFEGLSGGSRIEDPLPWVGRFVLNFPF